MDLGRVFKEERKDITMSRNRYKIAFDLHNMVPGPAGTSYVRTIYKSEDGILQCYGSGAAPTTANLYAEGCIYHKVNATGNDTLYVNNGTYASPSFELILSSSNVVTEIQNDHLASVADDNGPSPLIWDGAPLLDVMLDPSKGYHFFTDFFEGDYTSGASLFTVTQRTSGTLTNGVEQGGVCIFDAGAATAAQGITAQMHGISIKPEPNTTIRMEWRCKIDEDDGRILMGLGAVGTTDWLSDDSIVVNADCAVLFRDAGTGATDWSYQHSDGSTVQTEDDVFTASDAGYETFGIVIVGDGSQATDSITYYRNGVASSAAATDVADMPDAVMVPTFETNADGTDQPVIVMDWLRILVSNSADGSRA
jgi:hypothetical protein